MSIHAYAGSPLAGNPFTDLGCQPDSLADDLRTMAQDQLRRADALSTEAVLARHAAQKLLDKAARITAYEEQMTAKVGTCLWHLHTLSSYCRAY